MIIGSPIPGNQALLPRPCPCCGKLISDPSHIPLNGLIEMWSDVLTTFQKTNSLDQLGPFFRLRTPFIVTTPSESVNLIDRYIHLDGKDGRPKIDNIIDLNERIGLGVIMEEQLVEFLNNVFAIHDTIIHLNHGNTTDRVARIDLVDLLAVIKDSGWGFRRALDRLNLKELLPKEGEKMKPLMDRELNRAVYVGGLSGGPLSFPSYFPRVQEQRKLFTFKSWADLYLYLEHAGRIFLFERGLDVLEANEQFWFNKLWEAHKRLNGVTSRINVREVFFKYSQKGL